MKNTSEAWETEIFWNINIYLMVFLPANHRELFFRVNSQILSDLFLTGYYCIDTIQCERTIQRGQTLLHMYFLLVSSTKSTFFD